MPGHHMAGHCAVGGCCGWVLWWVARILSVVVTPDRLQRIERLAFAGKLGEAIAALGEPADYQGRWWRAYLHNCVGELDQALTLALEIAQDSGDGELASRALVTGGSALRQMGRHLAAIPLDEGALRLAPTDALRVHALIGLAADAAGLGRDRQCSERIDEAAGLMPPGEWRARIQLAWVRCELALITGRARKAVTHARDALDRSRTAKARRHEAKSLLFLAFCLREASDRDWVGTMKLARDIAERIGAVQIAEVAGAALPVKSPATRAPVKKPPAKTAKKAALGSKQRTSRTTPPR